MVARVKCGGRHRVAGKVTTLSKVEIEGQVVEGVDPGLDENELAICKLKNSP